MRWLEDWTRFLGWCERALETPPGRWFFMLVVVVVMGAATLNATFRAEVPRRWLVERPRYESPMEMGKNNDPQARWRSSEFTGFRRLSWGVIVEGRDPYRVDEEAGLDHVRAYPPFFALVFFPFAALWRVPGLGSALFVLLSAALALLAARYAAGMTAPSGSPRFGRFALVFILFSPLAANVITRCETDLLVVFPVALGAGWLAAGRRPFAAGAALGFAACFKVLPGLFAVYLLLTRRWRALGGMVAMGVVCMVVLPLLVWGPRRTTALYESWYHAVVAPYHSEGAGMVISNPYRDSNQSMTAALHRFLRPIPVRLNLRKDMGQVNLLSLREEDVTRLTKSLQTLAAAALASLWLLRGGKGGATTRAALLALVPCGILLLSEVSLTTHHALLLLPAAALLGWTLDRGTPAARRWSWVLILYCLSMFAIGFIKYLSPLFVLTLACSAACGAMAVEPAHPPARGAGRRPEEEAAPGKAAT